MYVSRETVEAYAGGNPNQNNLREGERVLLSGHVLQCGRIAPEEGDGDVTSFRALCLQTSSLKERPHDLRGKIGLLGNIIQFTCSCKGGSAGKCKHTIAVLLYISNSEDLPLLSCTDLTCSWKVLHANALDKYKPAPIRKHPCFSLPPLKRRKGQDSKGSPALTAPMVDSGALEREEPGMSKNDDLPVEAIVALFSSLQGSALMKRKVGRHDVIVPGQYSIVTEADMSIYKHIFENQDSLLMEIVHQHPVQKTDLCCTKFLEELSTDGMTICINSRNWFAKWLESRKYRITGSVCYSLFTYSKGEWEKKTKEFVTPKSFRVEATEHGNKYEKEARNQFQRKHPHYRVVEFGLVKSQVNPWLGYSPDGVIVKQGVPYAVLEIKCPLAGKDKGIEDVLESQIQKPRKAGCLIRDGENIIMKKSHRYYAQVQMGMAILNLKKSIFVMYSPTDKNMFILHVKIDIPYLSKMLTNLKEKYFNNMLPIMCSLKRKDGSALTTSTSDDVQHQND